MGCGESAWPWLRKDPRQGNWFEYTTVMAPNINYRMMLHYIMLRIGIHEYSYSIHLIPTTFITTNLRRSVFFNEYEVHTSSLHCP